MYFIMLYFIYGEFGCKCYSLCCESLFGGLIHQCIHKFINNGVQIMPRKNLGFMAERVKIRDITLLFHHDTALYV